MSVISKRIEADLFKHTSMNINDFRHFTGQSVKNRAFFPFFFLESCRIKRCLLFQVFKHGARCETMRSML
jgi:hypothetical protein